MYSLLNYIIQIGNEIYEKNNENEIMIFIKKYMDIVEDYYLFLKSIDENYSNCKFINIDESYDIKFQISMIFRFIRKFQIPREFRQYPKEYIYHHEKSEEDVIKYIKQRRLK